MVLLEAVPDFLRFPFVKMAKTEIREAKKRERRRQENRQKGLRSRAEAEADEEAEAEAAMEEEAVGAGMLPKKRQPTT